MRAARRSARCRSTSAACAARGVDCRVLYLEATTAALLRRFSETRRRHPLAGAGIDAAGGDRARARAARRRRAARPPHRHQRAAAARAAELDPRPARHRARARSRCCSSPSPTATASRSTPTGCSTRACCPTRTTSRSCGRSPGATRRSSSTWSANAAVGRWLEDVRALLARWLPEIARENRSYVTVAIGCTGGRHRSVYLAERLADSFRGDWQVLVRHRGLARDGAGMTEDLPLFPLNTVLFPGRPAAAAHLRAALHGHGQGLPEGRLALRRLPDPRRQAKWASPRCPPTSAPSPASPTWDMPQLGVLQVVALRRASASASGERRVRAERPGPRLGRNAARRSGCGGARRAAPPASRC